ncbi:MAG TPA: hypothetical protein V6C57_28460 [Coleofasciculaceae cyanobacterium]
MQVQSQATQASLSATERLMIAIAEAGAANAAFEATAAAARKVSKRIKR